MNLHAGADIATTLHPLAAGKNCPQGNAHAPGVWVKCETIKTVPTEGATSDRDLTKSAPTTAKTSGVSMATSQHKTDPRPGIKPDDHRHGTYAGYKAHGSGSDACEPCRAAAAAYERHRSYDGVLGRTRLIDSTGFRRRVEALQAIGWRISDLADEMGVYPQNIWRASRKNDRISYRFHSQMAEVYERLCMTVPDDRLANKRRKAAARKGFAPPLAWDQIDTDSEPVRSTSTDVVDEVKVARVLAGIKADCTPSERDAVIQAWDGSQADLQRITGWNINRLLRAERNAA